MKVSELVAQARDELYKGWVQNRLMEGESVCAVGALRRATMANVQHGATGVWAAARNALNEKAVEMADDVRDTDALDIFFPISCVEHFNDYHRTTKEDVLTLFDKTVIGLEEQGR